MDLAHELTTSSMWSVSDSFSVTVPRSTFSDVTRTIPRSGSAYVAVRVCLFRAVGEHEKNTISADLDWFIVRLLTRDHASILLVSCSRLSVLRFSRPWSPGMCPLAYLIIIFQASLLAGELRWRRTRPALHIRRSPSYAQPASHAAQTLPIFPLKFRDEVKRHGSRVMELYGEGCMILTSTVFDRSTHVTDRQTDRQTDGQKDGRWHIARYSIYAVAR